MRKFYAALPVFAPVERPYQFGSATVSKTRTRDCVLRMASALQGRGGGRTRFARARYHLRARGKIKGVASNNTTSRVT